MSAADPYLGLVIPDPIDEPTVSALPGNARVTGNRASATALPVSHLPVSVTGNGRDTPYYDVAAMLDGDMPSAPAPSVMARTDGVCLFYPGQVNVLIGDPESGKTMAADAAASETLSRGHRVLILDLDHNGPESTISRLIDLGAPETALRDPGRFRYCEPEDGLEILRVVRDCSTWQPHVVILDSVGELLPLWGASSNSPDDYTRVHAAVMKPLAVTGAAVICIDHLAKNAESRAMGSTGTAAKKRAVALSLRVTIADQFVPGRGGSAHITIVKDRHGGLRQHCPTGDREPLAGTFVMRTVDGVTTWHLAAPAAGDHSPLEAATADDVAALASLDPPPTSVREVRARMHWQMQRAGDALRGFRALPVTHTGGPVTGNTASHTCTACGEPLDPILAAIGLHPMCEVTA